jgi:hypothetical protein
LGPLSNECVVLTSNPHQCCWTVGAKTLFRSVQDRLRWAHAPKNWNMRFCAEDRFCPFCGARDASKQRLAADALPYEFA